MILKGSKLERHQIYFYQSKFGVQWIMPISEQNWCGKRVDVLKSYSLSDLTKLPKWNTLKEYMVEKEITNFNNKTETIWEIPKTKYGTIWSLFHFNIING